MIPHANRRLMPIPPPSPPQLGLDARRVPPALLVDPPEHVQHLCLLGPLAQGRRGNGQAADGDGGDAGVVCVGNDAANLVRMVQPEGVRVGGAANLLDGVVLGEDAPGRVVEEAAEDGGSADEPGGRGLVEVQGGV